MDGYVKVYDWMQELGLRPGELIAFAVIYSFGKDGDWYTGSASYLAKWMGVARRQSVYEALSSLTEKGIVEKRERWEKGQHLCDYRPVRKAHRGGAKNAQGPCAETALHNNRPDIDRDNKEIYKERCHLSVDEFIKSLR